MAKAIDLTGRKFGRLVVVAFAGHRAVGDQKKRFWRCRCDCGREIECPYGNLASGNTASCGCISGERSEIGGKRFGRLVAMTTVEGRDPTRKMWLCKCDCGATATVRGSDLRAGDVKSCGCLARKHGHVGPDVPSPTYHSWQAMRQRCTNPNTVAWKYYGARGIRVCERWQTFVNFLADMGERPAGKTLDRIDCDGNYEPGNCRWATQAEQIRNRRPMVRRSTAELRG